MCCRCWEPCIFDAILLQHWFTHVYKRLAWQSIAARIIEHVLHVHDLQVAFATCRDKVFELAVAVCVLRDAQQHLALQRTEAGGTAVYPKFSNEADSRCSQVYRTMTATETLVLLRFANELRCRQHCLR